MHTRFIIIAFASFIGLVSPLCNADTPASASKNVLVFGVVPQQAADKLALVWSPFLEYLSEKTGRTFKFESAPDIESFDKRTINGDFDLAYMNPMFYTQVHQSVGYQVFAKEKDTLLKGIVVVQKNSPYQKLEELVGKTIAFPGPNSFASTLLPLIEFKSQGINVTPIYLGSHEGVYNDVPGACMPPGVAWLKLWRKPTVGCAMNCAYCGAVTATHRTRLLLTHVSITPWLNTWQKS